MDELNLSPDVRKVSVMHTPGSECHMISTFIHHEMTPEREQELALFVEQAIMIAIKGFLKS